MKPSASCKWQLIFIVSVNSVSAKSFTFELTIVTLSCCFTDNTPPTLICPASRTVQLQDGDDSTILDFGDGTWNPVVSDTGGVAATSYSQPGVTLTASHLYQTLGPYTITAQDLRGNVATCNFYVSVIGMYNYCTIKHQLVSTKIFKCPPVAVFFTQMETDDL